MKLTTCLAPFYWSTIDPYSSLKFQIFSYTCYIFYPTEALHQRNLLVVKPQKPVYERLSKFNTLSYSKNISDVKKGKAKKVQITERLKGVKSL